MGRYYTFNNGDEGKFWFAVQPTADITEFGGHERSDIIHWEWDLDDLPIINAKIKEIEEELSKLNVTYDEIMEITSKGYNPNTLTKNQKAALPLCAKLYLGRKILKGVTEQEFLSAEAEC